LESEINGLFAKNEAYDSMHAANKEYLLENKQLKQENISLAESIKKLEKQSNICESKLVETNKILKQKSIIHIELEDKIQSLQQNKAENDQQNMQNHQTSQELNAKMLNLQSLLEESIQKYDKLNDSLTNANAKNQASKTIIIQKENIILAKDNELKQIKHALDEYKRDYDKLSRQHNTTQIKFEELTIKCKNYEMDLDIMTNRLTHFEQNEDNENESKMVGKLNNLRAVISELESQRKYNMQTIDELSKIKMESVQNQIKYAELKTSFDANNTKMNATEHKYTELLTKYQQNYEKLSQVSNDFEQLQIEQIGLKQSMAERDNELEAVQKQYVALNGSYTALQHQYSAYLHSANEGKLSKLELKRMSERHGLLKNDIQRLLLENEEWIKKYNGLKKNYDALNDEYILSKNHSMQMDALMSESKASQQRNLEQMAATKDGQINELHQQIKVLNGKIMDAENENIILRNKPTLTISEYSMLCDKENHLKDIVDKMFIADQSIEPSFKCTVCNDLFVDPITCQPCGHSYCKKCIKKKKEMCIECNIKIKYFQNEILENLTNKYKLRAKTYLPALRQMASRKTNVCGV